MIKNLLITAKCNALTIKNKVASVVTKKQNGDAQLVVALVLVAVAIGLCIFFREQIGTVMENLLSHVTQTIEDMQAGI